MKANMFAKPNLKLFLIAAFLIAVFKELLVPTSSSAEGRVPLSALHWTDQIPSEAELNHLSLQSLNDPSARLYVHISKGYQLRGDYHQAMHYLRKACLASEVEAEMD